MNQPVIIAEHISKEYRIRHTLDGRPASFKALLNAPFNWAMQRIGRRQEFQQSEPFLALDNVSFEIQHGDSIGLIGRNGAGKSTLLKILSRITRPSSGRVLIYERVNSLLEVGTGFSVELSGRDNIFLNGSFLGMRTWEIRRKFDEIVAFSEVEKFIDTPVKYYSSGMYVRLAFSVAVHLTPQILLLDEILSVGDSSFQVKSRAKMKELLSSGATIIFVSHNDAAVREICKRAIWLENGRVRADGEVNSVVNEYIDCVAQGAA